MNLRQSGMDWDDQGGGRGGRNVNQKVNFLSCQNRRNCQDCQNWRAKTAPGLLAHAEEQQSRSTPLTRGKPRLRESG
jgi:hypothetical protein